MDINYFVNIHILYEPGPLLEMVANNIAKFLSAVPQLSGYTLQSAQTTIRFISISNSCPITAYQQALYYYVWSY